MDHRSPPQQSIKRHARLRLVASGQPGIVMTEEAERILDEATDWLLLLKDRPDDRDTSTRFRQWIATDSRHAEVWKEVNHSYDLIGETPPAMADQWPPVKDREPRFRRQPRKAIRKAPLAALAVSVLLALWFAPAVVTAMQADYRTGTGELTTVTLADGSSARLGPASAIRVDYAGGERRVQLLAGEVLFQVKSDKARPFRVHAGDVTTTVLGTGFDVRRRQSGTEVGVQYGKVRVDLPGPGVAPVFLTAGDRVAVTGQGKARRDHMSPQLIASWALGEVIARDRPVAEVIDDLRPWHQGTILVMDDKLAAMRVNGVYNPRDVAKAIRSMVLPLGGTVTRVGPWLIVVSGD